MEELESYYVNCNSLKEVLENNMYLKNYFENENKKNLILKMSAYFEKKFDEIMMGIINSSTHEFIRNFVYKDCLERKFYKIFNFDIDTPRKGANSFFNKFGSEFSEKIKNDIRRNGVDLCIHEFILIVKERNLIIHTGKTSLADSYTIEEIYEKFKKGNEFLIFLEKELKKIFK